MAAQDVLSDDVAIVTGAGRNIGRAVAERFAEEGASVVVADIDEQRANETVERITDVGGEAVVSVTDVADKNQVVGMISTAEEAFGSVDILINNVAISDREGLMDLTVEKFDEVMAVNLRGTFLCTREVVRSMRKSGGGRIVNIGSTSAHKGRASAPAYATSKSGILNFTRSAAKALADDDIRVNTLSPTRSGSRVGEDTPRMGDAASDIIVSQWGTPEDQANGALFLVSPENDFINGTELLVDGGSSA